MFKLVVEATVSIKTCYFCVPVICFSSSKFFLCLNFRTWSESNLYLYICNPRRLLFYCYLFFVSYIISIISIQVSFSLFIIALDNCSYISCVCFHHMSFFVLYYFERQKLYHNVLYIQAWNDYLRVTYKVWDSYSKLVVFQKWLGENSVFVLRIRRQFCHCVMY